MLRSTNWKPAIVRYSPCTKWRWNVSYTAYSGAVTVFRGHTDRWPSWLATNVGLTIFVYGRTHPAPSRMPQKPTQTWNVRSTARLRSSGAGTVVSSSVMLVAGRGEDSHGSSRSSWARGRPLGSSWSIRRMQERASDDTQRHTPVWRSTWVMMLLYFYCGES